TFGTARGSHRRKWGTRAERTRGYRRRNRTAASRCQLFRALAALAFHSAGILGLAAGCALGLGNRFSAGARRAFPAFAGGGKQPQAFGQCVRPPPPLAAFAITCLLPRTTAHRRQADVCLLPGANCLSSVARQRSAWFRASADA